MRDLELIKRLFALTNPYRSRLIIATICMVGVSGLTSTQAYLIKLLLVLR